MKAYYLDAEWEPKQGYRVTERERAERSALESHMVWKNPRASVVERPVPEIKSNEVLLRIGACGVCGSDKNMTAADSEGYMKFSGYSKLPVIIGHELAGEVVEVGRDVKSVKKGDLIAAEQMQYCGKCYECRTGHYNQCADIQKTGIISDGGFAEYTTVEERFCCNINGLAEKLGDKLAAMEAGALAEPTGVAYNAMVTSAGGIKPGAGVAVFGMGAIGLAAVAVARAMGASSIIAFSNNPEKLKLAEVMGATHVYSSRELEKQGLRPADLVMDITKGIGADMLVEAAGSGENTYPEIEDAVAAGAKIVQLGMEGRRVPINLSKLMRRMTSIHLCIGTAGNAVYPSVLKLMEAGVIDMRKIVNDRYKIEDTDKAIDAMRRGDPGKQLVGQWY